MRWNNDDTECLKAMREAGWEVKYIAEEMGYSKSTIEYRIKKLNILINKKWTKEEEAALIELTEKGLTSIECSKLMDRNNEAIKTRRVILGLSKRKGFNGVLLDPHTQQDLYNKYIDILHKDISIIDCKGVKGNSTFACVKCGHTWVARLYDVSLRNQTCVLCTNTFTSKIANTWLDSFNIVVREYPIPDTKYRVDGFDPTTNTIYEFLGDFWHGNPSVYNPGEINPIKNVPYEELYNSTVLRFNKLKNMGYTICYIWENSFRTKKMNSYW